MPTLCDDIAIKFTCRVVESVFDQCIVERTNDEGPSDLHETMGFALQHMSKHATPIWSRSKFEAMRATNSDAFIEAKRHSVGGDSFHGVPDESVTSGRSGNDTTGKFHGRPTVAGPKSIPVRRQLAKEHSDVGGACSELTLVNVSNHRFLVPTCHTVAYGDFCTVPYGVARAVVNKSVTSATRLTRLAKDDWIVAAINAIEHDGIGGIAVEPIATALGATKGSFYWHFTNRDELIAATMQRWEELATNTVIANVGEVTDPLDRLRQLLRVVFGHEREDRIEARIVLAAFDPRVSPTVDRVTALRIEFLTSLFRGLGFNRATAAKRGRIAYAAYLGHLRLLLDDAPGSTSIRSSTAAHRAYADELLRVLTSPA